MLARPTTSVSQDAFASVIGACVEFRMLLDALEAQARGVPVDDAPEFRTNVTQHTLGWVYRYDVGRREATFTFSVLSWAARFARTLDENEGFGPFAVTVHHDGSNRVLVRVEDGP
jgi:hypothetical protein